MKVQDTAKLIAELRLLVGYLGEQSQHNWWSSNFLSPSSQSSLQPIYPRTMLLAQYHGVCEAALLVHDERIGVGANYHLYRFPELLERSAASQVQDEKLAASIKASVMSPESALARLSEISEANVEKIEGVKVIGDFSGDSLGKMLKQIAASYRKAFQERFQCFPCLRDA